MMTKNQRTFMKMKMMRTVKIIGAMNTQRRRTVMEKKFAEVGGCQPWMGKDWWDPKLRYEHN